MSDARPWRSPSPAFPSTHWSDIADAVSEDPSGGRPVLGELLARYRAPILGRLRRWGLAAQDVEDTLQDFVAEKVLQQGLLAKADRQRGRFRTFLLTALDRYVIDKHRSRDATCRRPPGPVRSLDEHRESSASDTGCPDPFDLEWARAVIAQGLTRMRDHCLGSGREELWRIFEARILRPILSEEAPEEYPRLVQRLGLKSYAEATKIATESKRLMQRYLRHVVAEYEPDDQAVETELADLFRILSEAGGADRRSRIC